MKRLFLILAVLAMGLVCYAQTDSVKVVRSTSDSLMTMTNGWLEQIGFDLTSRQRYKLYPTENMYTFLLLDTRTGKIDKVQWHLEKKKEFTVPINSHDLSIGYEYGTGSFELYPTQNMYQFVLLDGRTWHVQWGMSEDERWIRRIY